MTSTCAVTVVVFNVCFYGKLHQMMTYSHKYPDVIEKARDIFAY